MVRYTRTVYARTGTVSPGGLGYVQRPALIGPVRPAYANAPRKQVKRDVNYVDQPAAVYAANTTGTIALIATIAQGATVNQRVGKKAMYKSIQIRGSCSADSATTTCKATMLLIYDRRPSGTPPTLPAITDILTSVNSNAFMNDNNTSRFRVLRRLDFYLCGNNVGAGQQTSSSGFAVDEYVKLNKQVVFNSLGTGVIADIDEGALYCVTVGDQAAGIADGNFNLAFRTRFVDV